MSIAERVRVLRIGDGGVKRSPQPVVATPEMLSMQAESWRMLGAKVGFAVEELTGRNIFDPNPIGEQNMEWEVSAAEPNLYYDYRIIYLRRKVPGGTESIVLSNGSLNGLRIYGRKVELDETNLGNLKPHESTKEEIEKAFARAVVSPQFSHSQHST